MTETPESGESDRLSAGDVAKIFDVDPKTVTRWAKSGRLTFYRTLGGHRRYLRSEVEALRDATMEGKSK
jgi:excisionase family DNA binding protein